MASELESACLAIHLEDSNIVTTLVATVEKPAGGVEIEAARVVAAGPFVGPVLQGATLPHRENANAVVQAVSRIHKPAIA